MPGRHHELCRIALLNGATGVIHVLTAAIAAEGEQTKMNTENAETTDTAAAVAEQGANVAPDKASSKKAAPKGQKSAKGAKPKATAPKKATGAKKAAAPKTTRKAAKNGNAPAFRQDSKSSIILGLLRRPKGATMAEIVKAVNWQKHSIRGFLSGNLTKKLGLTLESTKNEARERTYRIKQ
jgi:hypothetical protein